MHTAHVAWIAAVIYKYSTERQYVRRPSTIDVQNKQKI